MKPYNHLTDDIQVGDLVIFNDHYEGRVHLPTTPGRVEWIGFHTYGIDFMEDQIRIVQKQYVRKVDPRKIKKSDRINALRSYNALVTN